MAAGGVCSLTLEIAIGHAMLHIVYVHSLCMPYDIISPPEHSIEALVTDLDEIGEHSVRISLPCCTVLSNTMLSYKDGHDSLFSAA